MTINEAHIGAPEPWRRGKNVMMHNDDNNNSSSSSSNTNNNTNNNDNNNNNDNSNNCNDNNNNNINCSDNNDHVKCCHHNDDHQIWGGELEDIDHIFEDDLFNDGEMIKQIMKEGHGERPRYIKGTKVIMHFDARTEDGKMIDTSRDPDIGVFELRTGKEFVIKGWEAAVKTMKEGEKARFTVSHDYASGYTQLATILRREAKKKKALREGRTPDPEVGGCCGHGMTKQMEENEDLMSLYGKTMIFEIEILEVCEAGSFKKDHWEMSKEEKRTACPRLRQEGNNLYRSGDYEGACEKYAVALSYMEQLSLDAIGNVGGKGGEFKDLELPCRLNYAACKLKTKDFPEVVKQCSEVLKNYPENTKALFRRGEAHFIKGRELELAKEDFVSILKIDPENKEAASRIHQVDERIEISKKKQNQVYSNMFAGIMTNN